MVVGGGLLGLFVLVYVGLWSIGRRPYDRTGMAYLYAAFSFLTLIVMELGWATDEIGRQPWIVYNVLTVDAAANYSSALLVPGLIIVAFYLILVPFTLYFMVRVFNGTSMEIEPAGAPGGTDVNY
jgi:cytochrome d ubiquinol oxidase subunit I